MANIVFTCPAEIREQTVEEREKAAKSAGHDGGRRCYRREPGNSSLSH